MFRSTQTKSAAKAILAALVIAMRARAQESSLPQRRILVNIPERKLALLEDAQPVRIYDIAVGAPRKTTTAGIYTIVTQVPHPTWYGPKGVVAPGKANPLGTRWIGLSLKGYGIHGTNAPASIGRCASHGCIRMRNADVEELFDLVRPGDTVELISEPGEEIAALFAPPQTAEPGGPKAE
jgi:lipoprotein-anchoring transpeptidase ErfK/SrfK